MLSKFAARLIPAELIDEERGLAINTASLVAYDGQVGQTAYLNLNVVPVGEPGKIMHQSSQLILGYWGKPAETEAAFVDG